MDEKEQYKGKWGVYLDFYQDSVEHLSFGQIEKIYHVQEEIYGPNIISGIIVNDIHYESKGNKWERNIGTQTRVSFHEDAIYNTKNKAQEELLSAILEKDSL